MPLININGVNYQELGLPPDGGLVICRLTGFHTSVAYYMQNGVESPFYTVNHRDWAVRVAPFHIIVMHNSIAMILENWLIAFSKVDCPVNNADEVHIKNVAGHYIFSKVAATTGCGIVGIGRLPDIDPDPYFSGNGFVTLKSVACECGAAKTYSAPSGSSLHSGWCPVAKKS